MARAPDERITQAKELYLKGMKLVEIASQLNLPEGTVRRWKSTYKWDSERSGKNSERSVKRSEQNKIEKKTVVKEVESVMKNEDLTDKQRLFCVYYSKSFNATQSYKKAYNVSYAAANVEGCKLLVNPSVKQEVMKLKQERYSKVFLSEEDIFQKYMDIAFSDITDYLSFGQEEVPVMNMFGPVIDEKTKEPITKTVNVVKFKASSDVDGSIIREVKQGKDGASIKLSDQLKALDWLTAHMDMATEEQRAKVAQMKAQTDKLTGNNSEIEDTTEIEEDIYGDK